LFFHFYFFHKYYAIPILFLSVFQREYIFFLAGLISLFDIIFNKKNIRYYTVILVSSVIFFGVYFVLRKTLFFTPKYSSQLAVGNYLERIINPGFAWGEYFRQTFLMQNTLFLYFGIILYKKIKKIRTNNKQVALVLLALLQAVIISFMAVLGNSAGRYFYIFCPAILVYIALETFEIINKKNDINNIS
jgi:hypothetical protein